MEFLNNHAKKKQEEMMQEMVAEVRAKMYGYFWKTTVRTREE